MFFSEEGLRNYGTKPLARVKVLKGLILSDNKHTESDSRLVENNAEAIEKKRL